MIFLFIFLLLIFLLNHKNQENFSQKIFMTFGGGGQNYINAGNRLVSQANNLNIFDQNILYTDLDLKNNKQFWNKHKKFIENNKRGYGYWIWKPYLIQKTMNNMNNGDILLYLDAGCELDYRKRDILNNYINIIHKYYIIGTYIRIEKNWNKKDLILHMNMNKNKYLNTKQFQGGVLLIYVCNKTRKLINEWYNIACNYHMIDDSPSISKNIKSFKEHRHDQSILSLLIKKYNLYNKDIHLKSCINIKRNKTGNSKLK